METRPPLPGGTAPLAHLVNAGLITAMVVWAVQVYPDLPDSIPVHFDGSGAPDRYADKSLQDLMLLPIVSAGLTGLMYLLGLLVASGRGLESVSMPRRDEFLALRPEQQAGALVILRDTMFWSGATVNLVFGALLVGTIRVSMGDASTLGLGIWIAVGLACVVPLAGVAAFVRAAGRAAVAAERERGL